MNIITIIGARSGSKRIPNKNLQFLGGYPLIAHSVIMGISLGYPVFVSTDSVEIANVSQQWGAGIIMRPPELATDIATDYDWIYHLLLKLEQAERHTPDLIAFLRPTTPFRATFTLKTALDTFNPNSSSLRSVEEIPEALEKHFRITDKYLTSPFPMELDATNLPNQVFPKAYKANGYIDILRPEQIKKGDIYGDKIQAYITAKSIEIDTLEDLDYANYHIQSHVS